MKKKILTQLLEVKGRAPENIQKILKKILRQYGFSTKGSCVYVTQNGSFTTVLCGIVDKHGVNRDLAIEINREFQEAVAHKGGEK